MTLARRAPTSTIQVLLKNRLNTSLFVLQLVAAATLLRSIAFDRWITVLGALLLIVGALAAQRGRTWGVGLTLGAAVAFPAAFAIGIAPAWFCLVGVAGAIPFLLAARPFARFDKGATVLLAALAGVGGTAVAISFKATAYSIFDAVPQLRPSYQANHGLALAATLAVIVGIVAGRARARRIDGGARVRIGDGVRVVDAEQLGMAEEQTSAEDMRDVPEEEAPLRSRRL